MVKMEMPANNSLDVFDIVSSGFDSVGKPVFLVVDDTGEYINQGCAPFLSVI